MRAIFFSISLLFIFSLSGQNYIEPVKLEYLVGGSPAFKDTTGNGSFNEFIADATIPIPLSDQINLITGFIFEDISTRVVSGADKISLNGYTLKLGLNKTFSDNWSANFILLPKLSSDMKEIGRKDFQVGAFILFKNDIALNKNFKYGLYTNTELFGPFFVPILGYYKKTGKTEISLLLPINADINRSIHSNLSIGANFTGFVKSYHLNPTDQHLIKANNELSGYLKINMKGINLKILSGTSIGRSLRIYDNEDKVPLRISAINFGDDRTQLNNDFKDGWFLRVILFYRFKIN